MLDLVGHPEDGFFHDMAHIESTGLMFDLSLEWHCSVIKMTGLLGYENSSVLYYSN